MEFEPFKTGERICFIGDSITELTYWISCIVDYYAYHTHNKIEVYPCGISGGACISANLYFDEQIKIWNPTTAVIMFGMNDIGRNDYGVEATEKIRASREESLKRYQDTLEELSQRLKDIHVNRIIYLAPTPYDEEQVCDTENLVGCQQALRTCAQIMQTTAEKFHGEFFDLGGKVYHIVHEAYRMNLPHVLISKDRVHPTAFGFSVMARIFLAGQGFGDMEVTLENLSDGTAMYVLSDKAQKFHTIAVAVQNRWSAEWLLARSSPDQTAEGKFRYMETVFASPEKYDEYFRGLARNYKKLVTEEKKNLESLAEIVKDLFK